MQAMNGNTALREIAHDAAQRFPDVFASEAEAMQRAADIAQQSSR
jgi:deoxyxylulose-5-phosphate synthase